ncbi:2OG-Fe(II) oxygenase [Pseudomonas sp. FEMGT703P]|uniref:2OG-Fe(II) oxygenase n=1 Tax=Pseudomonas sp. FEMGT703P TaxID=2080764 RepID=UPI00259D112C|nr:2OG-Fe(II) oxygenase [Pseudomonas sp. FEMGT703P]
MTISNRVLNSERAYVFPDALTASVSSFDDLLSREDLHLLYVSLASAPYRAWRIADPSKLNGNVSVPCDYLQAELDCNDFMGNKLYPLFREIAEHKLGVRRVKLSRVFANVFQYGDTVYPHEDYVEEGESVSILLFANEVWEKDWGGETYFYDGAVDAKYCIGVKPGRIIAFGSKNIHRPGVPSRTCREVRITLNVRFNTW